jgi:hypothetical protein
MKEVAKWFDVSVDWVHNHATRTSSPLPVADADSSHDSNREDRPPFPRHEERE